MFFGYSAFAQNTSQLLKDYMTLKNALVDSDSKGALQAALVFQQGLTKLDFDQKKDLEKAVNNLTKANGIDKQRAAFNDVSASFWKVVKVDDKIDEPVYYQYCPMKKSYWLSHEKEIKNPYYGASMLTCGKVVETK